jgi:hypothetical protein
MRKAEFLMAVVMGLISVGLMWKSTELPIGWIPGEGPGGGAFPFWLAAGMLVCCIVILIRWFAKTSPLSQAKDIYMDNFALKSFVLVAGALTVLVGLIHIVGVYVSVPLFLIFYLRILGGHRWLTTGSLAIAVPIVTFFFFEIALKITLPKGYSEPAFYPLYEIFL